MRLCRAWPMWWSVCRSVGRSVQVAAAKQEDARLRTLGPAGIAAADKRLKDRLRKRQEHMRTQQGKGKAREGEEEGEGEEGGEEEES